MSPSKLPHAHQAIRAAAALCMVVSAAVVQAQGSMAYEVIVSAATDQEIISQLEAENWWGEENRGQQLTVPRLMITGISPRWQQRAGALPVAQKKELFYRLLLPLVMHANGMVRDRRARLEGYAKVLESDGTLADDDLQWLRGFALLFNILDEAQAGQFGPNAEEWLAVIREALYRLDVIPPGLVLGQAAYESGYGTSRFAVEGNALFGQWTFGDSGIVPHQQRSKLGDHRIAAFEWPFDSVRSYFINLSRHPAYEDFRRLRAELKASGKPLSSLALADGLQRYSERGEAYVETLKGIIRTNGLDIADQAVLRDEPIRFLVGAENDEEAEAIRRDIESARASGELDAIVARMNLE